MSAKLLIIRFSSFGDIVQSLACVPELAKQGEVHFLTKKSFSALPSLCPEIDQVHQFDPASGLTGLIRLAFMLRKNNYHFVYDAHQNPRSKIVRFIVSIFKNCKVVIRPKMRWRRFLFFKLKRRAALPSPFKGIISFCEPVQVCPQLQKWDFSKVLSEQRQSELEIYKDKIVLVPSAAWEMKRWPQEHWQQLVAKLNMSSVVLGGPQDKFCQKIADESKTCTNLAGKLSLVESCFIVSIARAVISADTGLLHVADLQGVPVLALLGPTAFGFPTFENSKVLSVEMPCRPCTKDGSGICSQSIWRQCMVDIKVAKVLSELDQLGL